MGNFELKLYRLAGSAHWENEEFTYPYATYQWEMEVPLLGFDETLSELIGE